MNEPLNDGTILTHRRKSHNAISYVNAVKFNSNAYLNKNGIFSGDSDSKFMICSLWFKVSSVSVAKGIGFNSYILVIWPTLSNGSFVIESTETSTLNTVFKATRPTPVSPVNTWTHLALSIDMNNASNRSIYVNGSPLSSVTWDNYDTTKTFKYSSIGYYGVGTADYSNWYNDSLSEIWFSSRGSSYFDLATNITKFRTESGKPADLGSDGSAVTGTKPSFYLKNPAASFGVNAAGNGDFTLDQGTLTDTTGP